MKTLRVATCQFSVEADIHHNRRWILKQIDQAADGRAQVVHFSECALPGYAGVDIPHSKVIDWELLTQATAEIQQAAGRRKIWVLLGSSHRLSGNHKPHNSVYVIDPQGNIVTRYDKRYCTGACGPKTSLDLLYYSPGDHFTTFSIAGIKCGILICYDYRFPELYREYRKLGVDVLFQSFHNARRTVVDDSKYNIWKTIVPSTMSCRAAENYFWISANNSTARPSCWPSFTVQPDGAIVGRLSPHRPGVLFTDMKIGKGYFDPSAPWRDRTMNGVLHSGELVNDPRSRDLTSL